MSWGFDYCPYCDSDIEPDEIFEMSEVDGNEYMESIDCPHCGQHIRASLAFRPYITLVSEEDFLFNEEMDKERFEERLKETNDKWYIEYLESELAKIEKHIGIAKQNIRENEEMAKNE